MINFYLIRHGQKEAIPYDPPLTKIGIKQAELTADLLKSIPIKAIISSPKERTKQTAEILAKPHNIHVLTDVRLVERMEWENEETFDAFIDEWNKTDIDRTYNPRKGLSSASNGIQMKRLLLELSEKYKEGNIIIISHGGTIGDLLRTVLSEQVLAHKTERLSGVRYIDIIECSVTILKAHKGKFSLSKLGDIAHLSIPVL